MKKKILLSVICSICICSAAFGQSDRRSVVGSPITQRYKDAVTKGFYQELQTTIRTGYHGFVDFGYTFGMSDYDFGRFEFSTTHGYQFNPYVFVGGGLGVHAISEFDRNVYVSLDYRKSQVDIPLFVNSRITVLDGEISPFIDAKVGYYVTHHGGLYASIAAGCRFQTWGDQAVNIYVGYSYENLQFESYNSLAAALDGVSKRSKRNVSTGGLSVKVGYEF